MYILARHFGCRAQDPTLDIWSYFVKKKKEKKKHFTSSFEISITTGYQGLSGVTEGYQYALHFPWFKIPCEERGKR